MNYPVLNEFRRQLTQCQKPPKVCVMAENTFKLFIEELKLLNSHTNVTQVDEFLGIKIYINHVQKEGWIFGEL